MADYLTKCYEADTEAALQVLADILAKGKRVIASSKMCCFIVVIC